jgi:hypothetical protein
MTRTDWSAVVVSLALTTCATQPTIARIVVVDRGFVSRSISDPAAIESFERLWQARKVVETPDRVDWPYRLVIETGEHSDTWLYNPIGYLRSLTVKRTPTYRVPNPHEFNSLLGVRNSSAAPVGGREAVNPNMPRAGSAAAGDQQRWAAPAGDASRHCVCGPEPRCPFTGRTSPSRSLLSDL